MLRTIVLPLTVIIFVAACGNEEKTAAAPNVPRPAKVMILEGVAAGSDLVYSGQVKASKVAELSFEVAGKLDRLPVLEGKLVKKGSLIARLDQKDYRLAVTENEAKMRQAQGELKRASSLLAKGHVSKALYDKRKTAFDVVKVKLDRAKLNLGYTTLRAPFSGQIAVKFAENFQRVEKGTPIVSIQDVSNLEIHTDVPEAIIATIQDRNIGKIFASFDFIPDRKFELKFKERSTEADSATKTFRVVLTMAAPENAQILPGMTATVRATTNATAESTQFLLPSGAVISSAAKKFFVWVVDPTSNAVSKVEVTVGELTGGKIFVLTGLKMGQQVITAGANFLRDGMKVKPFAVKKGEL